MKYQINIDVHDSVKNDNNFADLMKKTLESTFNLNTFSWGTKGKVDNPMFRMSWGPVDSDEDVPEVKINRGDAFGYDEREGLGV
tara:strand:+ start:1301 stop:1552 length:252 start_codon:yes stop_codon:yes gene_type:complete